MTFLANTHTVGAYRSLSPLVLGSGSPRRRELLGSLGLDFEVCPSNAPEPPPLPGEEPEAYARRMAHMKTMDVVVLYPQAVVLGADTIVVPPAGDDGPAVLGKPTAHDGRSADEDALDMLTRLSGRTHRVITGCCLAIAGQQSPISLAVTTFVTMRTSTRQELAAYIATGEPHDKAGAYAIQGMGAFLVTSIEGSYTNVVGLPVPEIAALLLKSGLIAARGSAHQEGSI